MPSLQGVSGPEALGGGEDAPAVGCGEQPRGRQEGEPAARPCPQSGPPGRRVAKEQGWRQGPGGL